MAVADYLISESFAVRLHDSPASLRLAQRAIRLLGTPSERRGSDASFTEIRAKAWTRLGDALRAQSNLLQAEYAFRVASKFLTPGAKATQQKGETLWAWSILRHYQRDFAAAFSLLDRATQIYRDRNDKEHVAKAQILRASYLGEMKDHERSIPILRDGLRRVDPTTDPVLELTATHNLCNQLLESGDLDAASEGMDRLRRLHRQLNQGTLIARLDWVEAKLSRARGDTTGAKELLHRVGAYFAAQGMTYETAALRLELATICLQEGAVGEAAHLCRLALETFKSLNVPREAYATAIVLERSRTAQAAPFVLLCAANAIAQANPRPSWRRSTPPPPSGSQRTREGTYRLAAAAPRRPQSSSPSFRLARAMALDAFWAAERDPGHGLHVARTALALCPNSSRLLKAPSRLADLQGLCWTALGEALRIVSNYRGAEQAFCKATEALHAGTGDLDAELRLAGHKAILRQSQRRFVEALNLTDAAIARGRGKCSPDRLRWLVIMRGIVLGESGRQREAIETLAQAEEVGRTTCDSSKFGIEHNSSVFLAEMGEAQKAREHLEEARFFYEARGGGNVLLRRSWLEGKICAAEGNLAEASERLQRVRDEVLRQGLLDDTAQVGLDLAMVLLAQGRTDEVSKIASELLQAFTTLKVPRDAYAALLLLTRAAERKRLTIHLLRRVAAHLRH